MNRKKFFTTLALCLVFAVSCLIIAQDAFCGDGDGKPRVGPESCYQKGIAGVYIWMSPPWPPMYNDPAAVITTLTPLDPAGRRLTWEEKWTNVDHTFFSIFPDADFLSPAVGEVVKTGPNAYKYSIIAYGGRKRPLDRGEIQYMWVTVGSVRCVGLDIEVYDTHTAVYTPDQDADGDGMPDEGAVPVWCLGPVGQIRTRLSLFSPACEPPPQP